MWSLRWDGRTAIQALRLPGSAFLPLTLFLAFFSLGCSIPNLEPADCTQARDRLREFYSFHFGNDMRPTLENIALRERFLTRDFGARLRVDAGGMPPTKIDYFTLSEDLPKTFRVGECKIVETGKMTEFEVLLFWKDDTRSEQKLVRAAMRYENNTWLVDLVMPKER